MTEWLGLRASRLALLRRATGLAGILILLLPPILRLRAPVLIFSRIGICLWPEGGKRWLPLRSGRRTLGIIALVSTVGERAK